MGIARLLSILTALAALAQTQLTWVTSATLPPAIRGASYSAALVASGGTAPYTFSLANGSLPPGLQLAASGAISGTPTQSGTFFFILRVSDTCASPGCSPRVADRGFSLTAGGAAGLSISTEALPPANGCSLFSLTLTASGGTPPYTWSATGLPLGLTLNASTGIVTGTPQAGNHTVSITARDSAGTMASRSYPLTVTGGSGLQFLTAALPAGTTGTAYSGSLLASGGVPPYSFSAIEQAIPGVSVASSGLIAGTPAQAGSFATLYRVTDAAGCSATQRITVQIAAPPPAVSSLAITTLALPAGRAGATYFQSLNASGGTPSYTWSLAGGELPPGLELSAEGAISGSPLTPGVFPFLIRVTDSAQVSLVRQLSVAINGAMTITTETIPAGRVGAPYSATIAAMGGLGGLTWTISSGTLPIGLQLGLFSGQLTGTPFAAGEFAFEVTVKDADNGIVTRSFTLTVGDLLSITTERLPNGTIDSPYQGAVTAIGGVPPLAFEAAGLPPGLIMDPSGVVSGVPTNSGAWVVTVRVTDATGGSATRSVVISVDTVFRILTATLASGSAGTPYNELLTAVDGKPPYRWSVTPRSLPLGVQLGELTGQITGTPVEPGEYAVLFRVTDSVNATAERSLTISIQNGFRIVTESLPPANINVVYNAGLQTAGARTPIVWSVAGGAMPAGILLDPGTGTISGRPTAVGESSFTIRAVDATFTETSKDFKLLVRDVLRLSPTTLAIAEAGVAYEQKIAALDAQGALTWTLLNGALPDGLRLEFTSDGALLTGTPTRAGSYPFSIQARDASGQVATQAFTARVLAPLTIVTADLRDGFARVAYSATLAAEGGEPPYSWTVSSGQLPAGLEIDAARGVLAGLPTEAGLFDFTVQLRDSKGRASAKAFRLRIILDLTPTNESLSAATVGMPYRELLRTLLPDVAWAVTQGRLPDGLVLNAATGELRGVPAREGSYSFTIEARDSGGASGSKPYTIAVGRLDLPRIAIEAPPAIAARQAPVAVTLAGPAPTDLTGKLNVRFQTEAGADDPAVRLTTGRSAPFTVARGSNRLTFPGGASSLLLQTGTTAGTITLELSVAANGVAVTPDPVPTRTIRIARAVPVLTSVSARREGVALNIELTGFATGREVTAAEFQFTGGPVFTVSLAAPLGDWYRATQSERFGSLFRLTLPFLGIGSPGVAVTLINSTGRSQPLTARLP